MLGRWGVGLGAQSLNSVLSAPVKLSFLQSTPYTGILIQGLGSRVWGLGFRVQGLGFRGWGLGCRVQG